MRNIKLNKNILVYPSFVIALFSIVVIVFSDKGFNADDSLNTLGYFLEPSLKLALWVSPMNLIVGLIAIRDSVREKSLVSIALSLFSLGVSLYIGYSFFLLLA